MIENAKVYTEITPYSYEDFKKINRLGFLQLHCDKFNCKYYSVSGQTDRVCKKDKEVAPWVAFRQAQGVVIERDCEHYEYDPIKDARYTTAVVRKFIERK